MPGVRSPGGGVIVLLPFGVGEVLAGSDGVFAGSRDGGVVAGADCLPAVGAEGRAPPGFTGAPGAAEAADIGAPFAHLPPALVQSLWVFETSVPFMSQWWVCAILAANAAGAAKSELAASSERILFMVSP